MTTKATSPFEEQWGVDLALETVRTCRDQRPFVAIGAPRGEYGSWPGCPSLVPTGLHNLLNLQDPLGALGDAERIAVLARDGFAADHPDVAAWLAAFAVDEDPFAELQAALDAAGPGDERDAVAAWVGEHREDVDGWLGR